MKITNLSETFNKNKFTNFKSNIIQMPKTAVLNSRNITPGLNPSYYQSLYGVKPDILVDIDYTDGKNDILAIKFQDVKKYLCNSSGEINPQRIQQFAFLYKLISQGMQNEHNKEKARYIQTFNSQMNVFNMPQANHENETADDDTFVREQMKRLDFDAIENIKDAILYALKNEEQQIPFKAYERTLRLFQLSKTNTGYDFSSIDKKIEIIEDIEEIELEYGSNYSTDDLYNEIIEASKDKDGNIDFSLIDASFDTIFQLGYVVPLKYVINLIKKYVSKNPHNKDSIIETMQKLNKTDFSMNDKNTHFEDLMDLCFQGYHFNSKNANKVIELAQYAKNWIDAQQQNATYKGIDRAIFRYERYIEFCKNIIADYFEQSKDEKGSFDFDKINIEDFFNSKSQGIYFI